MYIKLPVSGHSATDKTPMYEMPRIFGLGVGVLGLGRAFFVLGFQVLAFCHWRFVLRSNNNNNVAECYRNLSILHSNRKEFHKALTYHEKSHTIRLQIAGFETSHIVAESYHDIRAVYSVRGDLQNATDFLQRALQILRKTLGNSHYKVGDTLLSLGELSERVKNQLMLPTATKRHMIYKDADLDHTILRQMSQCFSETKESKAMRARSQRLKVNRCMLHIMKTVNSIFCLLLIDSDRYIGSCYFFKYKRSF